MRYGGREEPVEAAAGDAEGGDEAAVPLEHGVAPVRGRNAVLRRIRDGHTGRRERAAAHPGLVVMKRRGNRGGKGAREDVNSHLLEDREGFHVHLRVEVLLPVRPCSVLRLHNLDNR